MCSWESFCDRGPDYQHLDFANGTLSAMLKEFAGIRKVSDESLGQDETHSRLLEHQNVVPGEKTSQCDERV